MLPRDIRLIGCDTYRDGGSMSVSFDDSNEHSYTLLLQVHLKPSLLEISYFTPVLEKYVGAEVVSPITNIPRTEWSKECLRVSWDEVRKVLDDLRSQAVDNSGHGAVLDAMMMIANSEGLPDAH